MANNSANLARYAIAQFTADAFRREPRNVGVIVEKNGFVVSRFLGETDEGAWNLPRLKGLPNTNAYRLWVDHWRKTVDPVSPVFSGNAMRSSEGTFCLIPGGEVANSGTDTAIEVCRYLYNVLVSQGGLAAALSDNELVNEALKADISNVFREHRLFDPSVMQYPIKVDQEIPGAERFHKIAFWQQAGSEAWAMEPIDFTRMQKSLARNHAAYARYAFSDLRARSAANDLKINTIALVRLTAHDVDHKEVERGLGILDGICDQIQWSDEGSRGRFVKQRVATGMAA